MKKALTFALLTAILGLSTGLQGASSYGVNVADRPKPEQTSKTAAINLKKEEKKIKKEKSAPAPSSLLLIGVAAGVAWGLRRKWATRRTE